MIIVLYFDGNLDICYMVTLVSLPQVKPAELTDFLQLKKSEGYCIVGVEQTANSQSLQDYQFPEKTLLLLGYEFTKNTGVLVLLHELKAAKLLISLNPPLSLRTNHYLYMNCSMTLLN